MSFLTQVIPDSPLIDGNYALITGATRYIGTIIPDITVEEVGTDTMRCTDHPVELGAPITDHAFKLPAELTMRCMWSDSPKYEGYSVEIYKELLNLQASHEPFSVSTGKRLYVNMIMTMLHQTNTEETEHGLVAVVGMREVLMTTTQGGSSTANAAPANAPQVTAPTNGGMVQPAPQVNGPIMSGAAPTLPSTLQ